MTLTKNAFLRHRQNQTTHRQNQTIAAKSKQFAAKTQQNQGEVMTHLIERQRLPAGFCQPFNQVKPCVRLVGLGEHSTKLNHTKFVLADARPDGLALARTNLDRPSVLFL